MAEPIPAVEQAVDLTPFNTFGLPARAARMVRIRTVDEAQSLAGDPAVTAGEVLILGGGSNLVLAGDLPLLVVKVEIGGIALLETREDSWIVEAGAGESWHDLVCWTLKHDLPGLENLALIPGSTGAAPVQNIGAYGVELADRFESLEVMDLQSGAARTLRRAECRFGYRDSIFKRELAGHHLITRVRLRLPRPWRPALGYPDLARWAVQGTSAPPSPRRIFARVCSVRREKLPDPDMLGNAGSFFKNPVVTAAELERLLVREPGLRYYGLEDGRCKVAAGWLIEACGWKGRAVGNAAVHGRQALVLVNLGRARGAEVLALAGAIQHSVLARFGLWLEPEPIILGDGTTPENGTV